MKHLSGIATIITFLLLFMVFELNAGQQVTPQFKAKLKTVQMASNIHVEIISFTTQKKNNSWYWHATIKNSSTKRSIPRGRMHIQTEQIMQAPFQSYPAGEFNFDKKIGPDKTQNVKLKWNKLKNTSRLKITVFDLKTHQVLATRAIQIPRPHSQDKVSNTSIPQAMESGQMEMDIRKEIEVVSTRYFGLGRWEAIIKNIGTVPLDAGDFKYTIEYDISGVRVSEDLLSVQESLLPSIGHGQTITIGRADLGLDCITFKSVNFKFVRTSDGAQFSHKIHVTPPVVTIDKVRLLRDNKFKIKIKLANNNDMNLNLKIRARVTGFSSLTPIQNFMFETKVELKQGNPRATAILVENLERLFRPEMTATPLLGLVFRAEISVIMGGDSSCPVEGILDRKFWLWGYHYEHSGLSETPKEFPIRWGW